MQRCYVSARSPNRAVVSVYVNQRANRTRASCLRSCARVDDMKTLAFLAKPFSFLPVPHRTETAVTRRYVMAGLADNAMKSFFASRVLSLKRMAGSTLGLFLGGLSALLRWPGLSMALIALWAFAASIKRGKSAKNGVPPRADTSQQLKPPLYLKFR
jgi:hypothetical protein